MASKDVAVLIVFPDYQITVDTPAVTVAVPDFLPWVDLLPNKVKIPPSKQKISNLGHAGILIIDGKSGLSRYYEYGRYDPAKKGTVRNRAISDVKMGTNGRPTKRSLEKVFHEISLAAGHGGRMMGAYIELAPGAFIRMQTYIRAREKKNNDPTRAPYDLLDNSCLHFMKQVAEAGGATLPITVAPHPAGYMFQVQLQESTVNYEAGRTNIEDVELE
jgi:hypothetical protein